MVFKTDFCFQVATKTAQRTFKKTEERIVSAETEIKEVEEEILTFKSRKEALENEAKDILDSLKTTTVSISLFRPIRRLL